MSKVTAIFMILVLGCLLAACGQSEQDKKEDQKQAGYDKMFGHLRSNSVKDK